MILKGLNVVEASENGVAAWAGKHFADWGARVISLEPRGGSALRSAPPYYERHGLQQSALWAWLSRGKTSVRAGEGTNLSVTAAQTMCERADVVLLETEMAPAVLGLKPVEVRPRFAGKTTCLLFSPFATDGPYAGYAATDLGVNALGGWMLGGDSDREPVRPGGTMNPRVSGLFGFVAGLVGLRQVHQGGERQFIDLSSQAAAASVIVAQWLLKSLGGVTQGRRGGARPMGVYKCADGYMGCSPLTDAHWQSICQMWGIEDTGSRVLDNETYERVERWFKERTRTEILTLAQNRRIPAAPVQTVAERLTCPQLESRGFWLASDVEGETVKVPRVPYLIKGQEPVERKTVQEAQTIELPAPSAAASSRNSPILPFAGLRVLDLTHFWAGPYCTELLGALGADVVKIESIQRPDLFRYTSMPQKERPYEWGPLWHDSNCDKRGITLDLASPDGKELFERLLPQADIVINNFSNRVMPSLGLAPERLLNLNPRLIVVSMPAYGPGGPWEDFVSYGVAAELLTGLAWMTGYSDGPPVSPGGVCDVSVAMHAAAAICLALRRRSETGLGSEVEIPQGEIFDSYYAPEHMAVQLGAPVPTRQGNRHEWLAPHNAYRVAGEDKWITIAVSSDEEFARLMKALGLPELTEDRRFATVKSRKENEAALDALISSATGDRDGRVLERELQVAGVKACRVVKSVELDEDGGLRHIKFFQHLTRDITGTHPYKKWPFCFSSIDVSHKRPPPLLGEHTAEVLTQLLGVSQEELLRFTEDRVIGNVPVFMAAK